MSPIVILYAAILLAVAVGLWGAYRVLGTPSRLGPVDYRVVLEDLLLSVTRSARELRSALEAGADSRRLEEVAAQSRKIFQTAYFQTLRLRPASGPDEAASLRELLGQACQAYDWASRMIGGEGLRNPLISQAARALLEAGDGQISLAARELGEVRPVPGSSQPLT
jgi:hypothetical protein